jgi:hypothetical protein
MWGMFGGIFGRSTYPDQEDGARLDRASGTRRGRVSPGFGGPYGRSSRLWRIARSALRT